MKVLLYLVGETIRGTISISIADARSAKKITRLLTLLCVPFFPVQSALSLIIATIMTTSGCMDTKTSIYGWTMVVRDCLKYVWKVNWFSHLLRSTYPQFNNSVIPRIMRKVIYKPEEPTQQWIVLQILYVSYMYSPKCFHKHNAELSKYRFEHPF